MRLGSLFALLVLSLGCASSKLTLGFGLEEGTFGGKGYRLNSITVEPGFYGRGCVDVLVERDGDVQITLQQDGTSDWIVGRAAPGALREVAIALMGFATKPFEIIGSLLGLSPAAPPGPSETHGCGGLFDD